MSGRDSISLAKFRGQKWRIFSDISSKWSGLDSDDEDTPISELGGDHRSKPSKSHSSHHKNSSRGSSSMSQGSHGSGSSHRNSVTSRQRGSVMRLDKADMGLYGLCPETDPFYAVICDICASVVKPQGLQKHMINRHHSYYNHAAKNLASLIHSNRDHHHNHELTSRSSTISSSDSSRSEKHHQSSSGGSSSKHEDLDNTPLKIRSSSSSSKIKSKNGKSVSSSHSSSHHNEKLN